MWRSSGPPTSLVVRSAAELGSFFSFYPGSSEIDWIGIDALDHQSYGPAGFRTLFEPWYAQWSGQDRPMMISMTAARTGGVKVGTQKCPAPTRVGRTGDEQAAYIKSIGTALNPTSPAIPQYPDIKAFIYWDSAWRPGAVLLRQRRAEGVQNVGAGAIFLLHGAQPVAARSPFTRRVGRDPLGCALRCARGVQLQRWRKRERL